MFLGDGPPGFFVEIVIRTVIIYAYTLVLLRWLGSRTIGQLSTVEFLLVIALGSAVGDAMFYPEVPLLHAMMVVTVVVVANKGLDTLIAHSQTAGDVIDGKPEEAVRHGVMPRRFLDRSPLSRSELFQQLRQKGIENLGQIDHAYVETDGVLTVFRAEDEQRPGLPIMPPWEIEHPPRVTPGTSGDETLACLRCGFVSKVQHGRECSNCGHDEWTPARIAVQRQS